MDGGCPVPLISKEDFELQVWICSHLTMRYIPGSPEANRAVRVPPEPSGASGKVPSSPGARQAVN